MLAASSILLEDFTLNSQNKSQATHFPSKPAMAHLLKKSFRYPFFYTIRINNYIWTIFQAPSMYKWDLPGMHPFLINRPPFETSAQVPTTCLATSPQAGGKGIPNVTLGLRNMSPGRQRESCAPDRLSDDGWLASQWPPSGWRLSEGTIWGAAPSPQLCPSAPRPAPEPCGRAKVVLATLAWGAPAWSVS